LTPFLLLVFSILVNLLIKPQFHPQLQDYTWEISKNSRQFGGNWDCGQLSRDICLEAEKLNYTCFVYHITPQHFVSYIDGYIYDGTHNSTYSIVPDQLAYTVNKDFADYIWRFDQ